MVRLIDADALKKAIMAEPWKNEPNVVRLTVDYINIIIDEQHTVDAVPVVHARWKYFRKQNIAVCTKCSFERNLDDNFGKAVSCPNCGAKMDLEVKNG